MAGETVPFQQWSSFFSVTAETSATLLGLLFIVITIAQSLGRKLGPRSRVYLTPAVLYLTSVLLMSAVLAIPNQSRISAAICICFMGSGGLFYSGSLTLAPYEKRFHRFRFAIAPFIAYCVLISGGVLLYKKGEIGLDLVAAAMLMVLNLAIRNSWSIAIAIISSQE
jgi:hypothetical protein